MSEITIELIYDIIQDILKILNNTPGLNIIDGKQIYKDGFCTWGKTNKGLIIEYSYGIISNLLTPYGLIRLRGSCSSTKDVTNLVHEYLNSIFHFEIYSNLIETEIGSFGPRYSITTYNEKKLPIPELDKDTRITYEECQINTQQLIGVINDKN